MREAVRFAVGPAFEINYALSVLTDERARIHTGWKRSAGRRLPASFEATYQRLGGHPIVWMMVSDAYPIMPADVSFDEVIAALESVSPEFIRRESLIGLIHYPDHVDELISGSASLAEVVGAIPKEKREWLMHIGMYPYDPASPAVQVVERLLTDPGRFRADLVRLLESFWQLVFRDTWRALQPQMQRSVEESERLFAASTFAELADALRLRIEVDDRGCYLHAIRGSARLPVDVLETCWILPSAFNDSRFWYSRGHDEGPITAYFPYFDPRINVGLDDRQPGDILRVTEPELDPALVFKALGNTTRYAIAKLLAQRPRPAADLAEALSLSKPTISHHVHLLREAGLLDETPKRGSVVLSLRAETLERLSTLTLDALFSSAAIENERRNTS
jgi:DNA-binding transcriptional ArsR family regulator